MHVHASKEKGILSTLSRYSARYVKEKIFSFKIRRLLGEEKKTICLLEEIGFFILLKYSLFSNADKTYMPFLLYIHILFMQEESSFATRDCHALGAEAEIFY